jgi:uncharacterized protein with HEPN domain
MSGRRRDSDYVSDILEATIARILAYTQAMSYAEFLQDFRTQDAVIRNLQIIGEAAKRISMELREAHQRIPWKAITGMRDRITHDYFGLNYDIVWNVVRNDLPALRDEISSLLQ